jgi:hypothetical protein
MGPLDPPRPARAQHPGDTLTRWRAGPWQTRERPSWRQRIRNLAIAGLIGAVVTVVWYALGGWHNFYVNSTLPTQGGDAAVSVTTDHTTYLNDEPIAITVTNRLPVPIFTQVTPDDFSVNSYGDPPDYYNAPYSLGPPCTADFYAVRLDGNWGEPIPVHTLGVGAGCDIPCRGNQSKLELTHVLAIASGASYTQRWQPSKFSPTNPPGTYLIVFRYATDPAAARLTHVGYDIMPGPSIPGAQSLAQAVSAPVQVADDGLHHKPDLCTAV